MNVADQFRLWLQDRNLLENFRIQFGVWKAGTNQLDQFAVIRPIGGIPSELVKRPVLSLSLIGAVNMPSNVIYDTLNRIIDRAKTDFCTEGLPFIDVSEVTVLQTEDARPLAVVDIEFIQTLESDL